MSEQVGCVIDCVKNVRCFFFPLKKYINYFFLPFFVFLRMLFCDVYFLCSAGISVLEVDIYNNIFNFYFFMFIFSVGGGRI